MITFQIMATAIATGISAANSTTDGVLHGEPSIVQASSDPAPAMAAGTVWPCAFLDPVDPYVRPPDPSVG
jgi:hypothetical protein